MLTPRTNTAAKLVLVLPARGDRQIDEHPHATPNGADSSGLHADTRRRKSPVAAFPAPGDENEKEEWVGEGV